MARIVVVGAGGVGGLVGGRLALSGQSVAYVTRGEALGVLRERGLTLLGPEGEERTPPLEAAEDPAALATPPVDYVLVAVKTWQVPEIAPRLKPLLSPRTLVIPLQNGISAIEQLAAALGDDAVAGGFCYMLSFIDRPGVIRWKGAGTAVTLGVHGPEQAERLEHLRGLLEGAGIRARVPPDFEALRWSKLLFVAPFGAVGAVTGQSAGGMRSDPAIRAQVQAAMEDIARVARARGVDLPGDAVAKALASLDSLPPDGTASLHRDIEAGRPSELEEWLGDVVRMGEAAGVPVETCARLYAALLPRERAARAKGS